MNSSIDTERLVELWSDVQRSHDQVETLSRKLEISATKGLVDSTTHQVLGEGLDRERQRLNEREAVLQDALRKAAAVYVEDPEGVYDLLEQAAIQYEDQGRERPARWLRDTIKLLEDKAVLAVQPPPLPERFRDNSVAVVQRFLITYLDPQVEIDDVTGDWDEVTEEGVKVAIQAFQASPFWNLDDIPFPSGVMTPEFYLYLMERHDDFLVDEPNNIETIDAGHFFASLWSLYDQRVYVPEPFVVTADRLLAGLMEGQPDGRWWFEDVEMLGELFSILKEDYPEYSYGWPDAESDRFINDLRVHVRDVAAVIFQDAEYDGAYRDLAFRIVYLVEALSEIEPEMARVASAYLTDQALKTVQGTILSAGYEVPGLSSGHAWGTAMAVGLSVYLADLQDSPDIAWPGSRDGLYTPEFAAHFRAWLEPLDPENAMVYALTDFANSMDRLVAVGVYSPSEAGDMVVRYLARLHEQQRQAQGLGNGYAQTGGPIDGWHAFLLVWSNGFAFEWGDEGICWWIRETKGEFEAAEFELYANELLANASYRHPWLCAGLLMAGRMMSIFGFAWIVVAGVYRQEKEMQAFVVGGAVELGEAILEFVGEWHTLGVMPPLKYAAFFAGGAMLLTGIGAALVAHEPKGSHKRLVEFSVAEGVGSAAMLFFIYRAFVV